MASPLNNLERAERAEAERDVLRAQLDGMTERHFETRGDGKVYTRFVGPWAEVTD